VILGLSKRPVAPRGFHQPSFLPVVPERDPHRGGDGLLVAEGWWLEPGAGCCHHPGSDPFLGP